MGVKNPGGSDTDPALRASIESAALSATASDYVEHRWLDQLQYFERKASKSQSKHRSYRYTALVGGVMLPVLVNLSATRSDGVYQVAAIVVSLVVGLSAGLETFRNPGELWIGYRSSAERLRSEWWLFVNLAGVYVDFDSRDAAHTMFVERVESIINDDMDGFVAIVTPTAKPASAGTAL